MLSFLHVAVKHGVVVTGYEDRAEGVMRTNRDGSGQFESVTLKPRVTVADPAHAELLAELHRGGERGVLHRPQRQLPGPARARWWTAAD